MEKISTLLKTLTAFRELLFTRGSNKNVRIINNKQTSVTGCCAVTAITHKSFYRDDAKQDASFLFFEQAPHSEEDKKVKAKEDTDNTKKTNDEFALGSSPKPVHKTWRERVNDDLAACTAVDDPLFPPIKNSIKRQNENIIDHIFIINDATTTNDKTKARNNDALVLFASFSFLCKKFNQSIFNAVKLSKTQKLVLVRIPVKKSFER
jgi:hypothetical protein